MGKKTTIKDFMKDKMRCKIVCPRCKKSNTFNLIETTSGYMQFECVECRFPTIMPFKKSKRK